MPLEFADFAHYYDGHGLSDEQSRTHFSAFADLLECLTRMAWQESSDASSMGITLDGDTLALLSDVDSPEPTATTLFNAAVSHDTAEKKEP